MREFARTGFTGGLNWYRNMDRNWATTEEVPANTIAVPALFIGGRADPVLGFTRTDRAREVVTGPYREEWLDGAGHWIPQGPRGRRESNPAGVPRLLPLVNPAGPDAWWLGEIRKNFAGRPPSPPTVGFPAVIA
jgi:pimeloyl-ACP methyl ester carboxylesterase